jgi:hypothetical protein
MDHAFWVLITPPYLNYYHHLFFELGLTLPLINFLKIYFYYDLIYHKK